MVIRPWFARCLVTHVEGRQPPTGSRMCLFIHEAGLTDVDGSNDGGVGNDVSLGTGEVETLQKLMK